MVPRIIAPPISPQARLQIYQIMYEATLPSYAFIIYIISSESTETKNNQILLKNSMMPVEHDHIATNYKQLSFRQKSMINLKLISQLHSESESAKINRRNPKSSKQYPLSTNETNLENQEQPLLKTEVVRTAHNILQSQDEEKPRNILKLPQIGKKQSQNFQDNHEASDRKENQIQTEDNRPYQNHPMVRKYGDRKSMDKIKSQQSVNFLNIVGVKPTVRSSSRMSNKQANFSLGHDRFEKATLQKEKGLKEKLEEEGADSPSEIKEKKRRVSTNYKSSTSQKIEASSRPKKSMLLNVGQKKRSSALLRIEKPKQSPNYYQWCLLIGILDAVVCEKQSGPTYKAFVGKGNNSILVKTIIKARPWWTLCQEESEANLYWTQSRNPKFLDDLKEGASQVPFEWQKTVKARMSIFGSIQNCLNEKIKDCVNLGFYKLLSKTEREILCKSQASLNLVYPKEWRTVDAVKQKTHNHLQFNWNLTNKKALYYNMKAYYLAIGKDPFDHIPETYHVQKEGDEQWNRFLKGHQKKGFWIIKPGQNSNQGCGIDVVETLDDAREIVRNKSTRSNGKLRSHIIQRYLMPFLYNKRKFDIRCYMLVTSVNGNLRCYWYEEGYVRTASKEFTTKNLKNRMIHLTNDAVQKHSEAYGKHQNANKLSFADFHKYVKNVKPEHDFYEECYPRMVQLAADTIRATQLVIDAKHREFSFQVFGLDFMIDEHFNTWLIEVNTNPCLELCCPLLARLIPSMLENAFRLAVDPIFPPPKDYPRHKGLAEDLFETNKFTLVFSSKEQVDLSRMLQPSKLQDIVESEDESECDLKDD